MRLKSTLATSLLVRLMAAFALVILVTVAIIYVVANMVTTSEFRWFMFRGRMAAADQIATDLAEYYTERGSWQGVGTYWTQSMAAGMGAMMGPAARNRTATGITGGQLLVTDPAGNVLATRDRTLAGQKVSSSLLADGTPIRARGQVVGVLVDTSPVPSTLDTQQQDYLTRVNLSILLAGVMAAVIALILGGLLFYQITAPLEALVVASSKIAAGDLGARVARLGTDEIGQVGQAFNAMAASLARSEESRTNMIADIAHELRNPLSVIQGQLEGMLDGVFPTSRDQIASVHDETLLLNRLVADLRELALADAGQLPVAREPVDLVGLIDRTVAAFAPQADEQGVTLTARASGPIPLVSADGQRIEQVLGNLIANALGATPGGGSILVECAVEGGLVPGVLVRVRDSGTGIAPADLPHVFERFWRGDKSRSRQGGGAGLGLAIARQLVAAHGGKMGVESVEGQGATFWFTLRV